MRERGTGNRREERGLVLLACSLFLVSCSLGCSKPKKAADAGKKKEKEETPLPSLAIGGGSTTIYGSATATLPSFNVRWTSGGFDAAKGTVSAGHLENPQGEIFTNGKATSTYRADTGDAIRESTRLDMRGGVVLMSVDKKQTLKSPAAQYRGDVKIIRATGGVVASGPFGTLSGVPELWATPDLRLIGTPDMVSKTLKIPALVALAATATMGYGKFQNGNDLKLGKTGPASADNRDPAHPKATIRPPQGGPLIIELPSRGLVFRFSQTVFVDFVPKTNQVRHMTSQGPVNVVQTTSSGHNTIDGVNVDYDAKPGADTATLGIGGRVVLVSVSKEPNAGVATTTSKGDKGSAVLVAKPAAGESGLRTVTLTGNVTIDSRGAGDDTFRGTGERLVYSPGKETSDVDLSGGVVLTRVTKGPDGSNTVVSRGQSAHAVLDSSPGAAANPMKNATLVGGVAIDVSGTNGQSFKGSGDKVVYTAQGEGGRAVMTGDLKFGGDAPSFLGDLAGADTAIVTIGKNGWQTVDIDNSGEKPTTTTIKTKTPPAVPRPKKKGGKR